MSGSDDSKSASQRKRERRRRRENASEIIRENVRAARTGWQDAETVASELVKLEQEERPGGSDSRQVKRQRERARTKLEGRRLRLLERDDEYVRGLLDKPHSLEGASPLEGTTDADELLHLVVDELELLPEIAALTPGAAISGRRAAKR